MPDEGDRESMSPDLLSDTPPVPPRRRDRKRHTPPRPISNGLPPTPKVHMGACFSKVSSVYLSIFISFQLIIKSNNLICIWKNIGIFV